jgi:hypothetical protein
VVLALRLHINRLHLELSKIPCHQVGKREPSSQGETLHPLMQDLPTLGHPQLRNTTKNMEVTRHLTLLHLDLLALMEGTPHRIVVLRGEVIHRLSHHIQEGRILRSLQPSLQVPRSPDLLPLSLRISHTAVTRTLRHLFSLAQVPMGDLLHRLSLEPTLTLKIINSTIRTTGLLVATVEGSRFIHNLRRNDMQSNR